MGVIVGMCWRTSLSDVSCSWMSSSAAAASWEVEFIVLISSLGVITGRLLPTSIRQLVTSMEKEGTSYITPSRTLI